jgi:hypothetical protein
MQRQRRLTTALQDVILPHKDNGSYGQCRAHGGEKGNTPAPLAPFR